MSFADEYTKTIKVRKNDDILSKKLREGNVPLSKETLHTCINNIFNSADEDIAKIKKKKWSPQILKIIMLFYSYFSRISLGGNHDLLNDLNIIIKYAHQIVLSLMEISTMKGALTPLIESLQISQMLTQRVWSESCKLGVNTAFLQLPHISPPMLDTLQRKMKITSVAQFAKLPSEKRQDLYTAHNLVADKAADIEAILKRIPHDMEFEIQAKIDDDDNENAEIPVGYEKIFFFSRENFFFFFLLVQFGYFFASDF
jgi:hypothetical protein